MGGKKGNTLNSFQGPFTDAISLVYVSTCPWDKWKAFVNSPNISGP